MNKPSRWATLIGVVCGAELVVAMAIGGAGVTALWSFEAAIVVALLAGAAVWALVSKERRIRSRE